MEKRDLDLEIQELKEKIRLEKEGMEETKRRITEITSHANKLKHENLNFCTKTVNDNVSVIKTALLGLVGAISLLAKVRKQ